MPRLYYLEVGGKIASLDLTNVDYFKIALPSFAIICFLKLFYGIYFSMTERIGIQNQGMLPQPVARHLELTRFFGHQLREIDQIGARLLTATPTLPRSELITSIFLGTNKMTISRIDEALGVINQMYAAEIDLRAISEVIVREPLHGVGLFYEVNMPKAQNNSSGQEWSDRQDRNRARKRQRLNRWLEKIGHPRIRPL